MLNKPRLRSNEIRLKCHIYFVTHDYRLIKLKKKVLLVLNLVILISDISHIKKQAWTTSIACKITISKWTKVFKITRYVS